MFAVIFVTYESMMMVSKRGLVSPRIHASQPTLLIVYPISRVGPKTVKTRSALGQYLGSYVVNQVLTHLVQ